jgi:serine/threonine-protein kinase RsbW
MYLSGPHQTQKQLSLEARLSEVAKAGVWVEGLASDFGIPLNAQLAVNLCLEEVLTNVILHGYGGGSDGSIVMHFSMPRAELFVFTVEDEAPHFNPLEAAELPGIHPNEEVRVGGQGIRFLRRFADSLEYQATPTGNLLRMEFSSASASKPFLE